MNRIDNMARAGSDQKKLSVAVGGILLSITCTVISLIGIGILNAQALRVPRPMSEFGR
jgi:hypothetical protein